MTDRARTGIASRMFASHVADTTCGQSTQRNKKFKPKVINHITSFVLESPRSLPRSKRIPDEYSHRTQLEYLALWSHICIWLGSLECNASFVKAFPNRFVVSGGQEYAQVRIRTMCVRGVTNLQTKRIQTCVSTKVILLLSHRHCWQISPVEAVTSWGTSNSQLPVLSYMARMLSLVIH